MIILNGIGRSEGDQMIIGIVGNGSDKFTFDGSIKAIKIIDNILNPPDMLSSGHSILEGIDIWSERVAKRKGCYDEKYIFKPLEESWQFYRHRNLQIATVSNELHIIVVDVYPRSYREMRFDFCYHDNRTDHVKSGACYTGNQFRKIHNKEPIYHVVHNY